MEELDKFAVDTLQALIKMEKKISRTTAPTLQHVVRMDIGFMWAKETGWAYFVNEVTRATIFSTWLKHLSAEGVDKIRVALVQGWFGGLPPDSHEVA
jgi:hypothetical protein